MNRDTNMHLFCLQWAHWHRTRKLFAPPPPKNLLARLRTPPGLPSSLPDAPCDAELNRWNKAVNSEPMTDKKMAFICFYIWNLRVSDLMDHYDLSRDTIRDRIRYFRDQRVLRAYSALQCGRYVDSHVIRLSDFRKDVATHQLRAPDGRFASAAHASPHIAPKRA